MKGTKTIYFIFFSNFQTFFFLQECDTQKRHRPTCHNYPSSCSSCCDEPSCLCSWPFERGPLWSTCSPERWSAEQLCCHSAHSKKKKRHRCSNENSDLIYFLKKCPAGKERRVAVPSAAVRPAQGGPDLGPTLRSREWWGRRCGGLLGRPGCPPPHSVSTQQHTWTSTSHNVNATQPSLASPGYITKEATQQLWVWVRDTNAKRLEHVSLSQNEATAGRWTLYVWASHQGALEKCE